MKKTSDYICILIAIVLQSVCMYDQIQEILSFPQSKSAFFSCKLDRNVAKILSLKKVIILPLLC